MSAADLNGTLRQIGGLIVALAVLAVVLGSVIAAVGGAGTATTVQEAVILGSDGSGQVSIDAPNVTNAQQSLGTGVNLSGGAYSASGVAALEPPFTVTIYVDSRTNSSDQTVYSIDSDNQLALSYNQTGDEYRAFWYNESSRESALATVAAGDVTTPTVLAVRHDGSSINVSANGTTGTDATPAVDGGTAQDAGGWLGQQDEVRVFNATLNSSELSTLRTTPTDAITTAETTSRIMFDARSGSVNSRPVYFSGGSVDLSGLEIVDTVAGQPTDDSDYSVSGSTLSATAGGTLDGSPVAFVTATGETPGVIGGLLATLTRVGGAALGLLVIGMLLIAANAVLSFFREGF